MHDSSNTSNLNTYCLDNTDKFCVVDLSGKSLPQRVRISILELPP